MRDWKQFLNKTPNVQPQITMPIDGGNGLHFVGANSYLELVKKVNESMTHCVARLGQLSKPIKVVFNLNMRTTAGRAFWTKREVHLNIRLLAQNPEEFIPTFVHELCHIVANDKYGPHIDPHGHQWKTLMIRAGYAPDRCHNMDTASLQRERAPRATFAAECGCQVHMLGPKRAQRLRNGMIYKCTTCKGVLTLKK